MTCLLSSSCQEVTVYPSLLFKTDSAPSLPHLLLISSTSCNLDSAPITSLRGFSPNQPSDRTSAVSSDSLLSCQSSRLTQGRCSPAGYTLSSKLSTPSLPIDLHCLLPLPSPGHSPRLGPCPSALLPLSPLSPGHFIHSHDSN